MLQLYNGKTKLEILPSLGESPLARHDKISLPFGETTSLVRQTTPEKEALNRVWLGPVHACGAEAIRVERTPFIVHV